jgi:hypothetical protein
MSDNSGSMIAAYVVAAAAYIIYGVSLWLRHRNARRGPQ